MSTIKRRNRSTAPLSIQQKNIWMEHELYPDNISYNMFSCLRLSGELNTEAFKKSLAEIVQRHEVFRAAFSVIESEPRQTIHQQMEVAIPEIILNSIPPEEQEAEIQQLIRKESQSPFDLTQGPLFRFTLLPLKENEHVFLMTIHHIVMDGWSVGLFSNELKILYEAFCNDKPPPLQKTDIQYSDYAIWQNEKYNESREQSAKYWNNVIKDAVFGEFPPDHPRVFGKKAESATQTITIPADLVKKLKSFSREVRATPFAALMSAFKLVLHKYTDHDNLLIGCYTAGRDQGGTRNLLGQYSCLTAIKTDFSGNPDFREIVRRTRKSFFDAYAQGQLLVSNLSKYQGNEHSLNSTLFPVVFNYHNFPYPDWKLYNLNIKPEYVSAATAGFDMEISIIPVKDELTATIQYRKDIYSENTIKRILNHYRNILTAAISNPDQPIHELSVMSSAEIRQITEDWNSEKAVYPTDSTIPQLIDATEKEIPGAIALTYKEQNISYKELINQSSYIAHRLVEMGVGPEVMVGVLMERTHNLIIAILAILKAGGAYVPLDPIYPDEKLTYMLQNSNALLLVSEKSQIERLHDYDGDIIEIEFLLSKYSDETAYDAPSVNINSENSAYLIYTSGSTGKPKCVQVTHRNVINSFCFMNIYIDDAETARTWLFSTSISFDPSVLEMFWTLSRGYRVVVLPDENAGKHLNVNSIPELIQKYDVSHLQCTPSTLRMLMARTDGIEALKRLSKLMIGGENFPVDLAKKLSAIAEIDIYNIYGPTETTLWATWHHFHKDDNIVPIGRPWPNYEIYILDRNNLPVPIGVYGEMYIGGDGVAHGYFNDPELTGQKYIPDPFSGRIGDRIYRTGDIARYRDNGIIEFRGRADRQVKIRGHRIEPGEVEAAIMDCDGIREAVVIASGSTAIDQKLLGYVIPDSNFADAGAQDLYIKNLKSALYAKLPEFMIPSSLMVLKEFPKLSNGKIDRKSLPLPEIQNAAADTQSVLSPTESAIMEAWKDVLEFDGFDANDNFMDIGGNSLSAIIIINRIKSIFNVNISIRDFLDNPTIRLFSKLLEQRIENSAFEPLDEIVSINRNDDIPLSFFQEVRLRHEFSMDVMNVPYLHLSAWFSIKLFGKLDREALENAFNHVINRHEVFRTAFWPVIDATSPGTNKWNTLRQLCSINPGPLLRKIKFKQSVHPTVKINLDYYDISEYNDEDKNIEIKIIGDAVIEKRYTYESAPLTRAALVRTAESEHILAVAASHLIADAISMDIYEKELSHVYNALTNKQVIQLPEVKMHFADYTAWMRYRLEAGSLDPVKSYWQKQLGDYIPADVTILPFTDIEGSENDPDFSMEINYHHRPFPDELSRAIRKYAGSFNMTPFSILMTGFILCIYRESGENDIGVLAFFANRSRQEFENTIGMFSTGNIIRVKVNADDSFHQCAAAVSESINGALKNQELMMLPPDSRTYKSRFDYVVHRPITCEYWIDNEPASFSGTVVEKVILERNKSEHALKLYILDSRERLSLLFQYNLDLFDGADIRKIAARTENLIREIVTNPVKTISSQGGL